MKSTYKKKFVPKPKSAKRLAVNLKTNRKVKRFHAPTSNSKSAACFCFRILIFSYFKYPLLYEFIFYM